MLMANRSMHSIFTLLFALSALAGCAKYKPRPLQPSHGHPEQKEKVSIAANPLSEEDCRHYFSRRAVSKGYQPILLTIRNKSDKLYTLNTNDINLNIESSHIVAKDLHVNTAKRIATWGFGSLFFWPLIIPAAYDGVQSSHANKALDRDFSQRVLDKNSKLFVKPNSTVNKIIFVTPQNYRSQFELALIGNQASDKLEFNITC